MESSREIDTTGEVGEKVAKGREGNRMVLLRQSACAVVLARLRQGRADPEGKDGRKLGGPK